MKKLFALFMVVAMLSVAGTAMATSITASSTSVELVKGDSTTVTVTGTASHGGTLGYSLVYGLGMTSEWASISGTNVTLTAPSTASKGFYTVIVRATETYYDMDDAAGHVVTKTETADVSITVNVLVPSTPNTDGGSQAASSKTETLFLVRTKKVTTKTPSVNSLNVASPADAKKPTANDSKVAENASSYASRFGQTENVELVSNGDAEFEEYDKSGQDLVDQKAAEMSEELGSSAKGNERLGPPQPRRTYPKAGLSTMDLNYGSDFAGSSPRLIMKVVGAVLNSEFSASATEDVIFLDKDGNEVTTIPEDGVVTAVTYVKGGTTYDPIVFAEVPADKLAAFDTATGTEEKTVELETVTRVTETVHSTETFSPVVSDARIIQAVSDDYGEPVTMLPYTTASTTKTWSASTEETSYMTANNLVYVCSLPVLENIPDGTYIATITFDNTPTRDVVGAPKFYPNGVNATGAATSAKLYTYANGSATEITASNAEDVVVNGRAAYLVFEVAGGAVATADLDAAAVTLSKPAIVVSNINSGSPEPVIDAKVQELIAAGYVTADGTALTNAALASKPEFNQDGDLVSTTITLNFSVASWYLYVAGSQVATADFEASATGTITKNSDYSASGTIDRSTIASGTTASVSFGVIPTGSAITTPLTYTLGNVTGTGSDIRGVGSSSGGCSAASAVLALAVLGSFVLTRKK